MNRLLAALQGPLYAHIFAIVRNRENAEDVLQDTLFTIARKIGTVTEPVWIRAWAYRIANRKAVRRSQKSSREEAFFPDADLDLVPAPEAPERLLEYSLEELKKRLESLSPASAVVLQMHYVQGLTYAEIGEALELPIGTVKSRLAYGLAALRRPTAP